jgi:hypothetical protein
MSQTTAPTTQSTILMIRPVSFGFNEQTAESNAFQQRNQDQHQVQHQALIEFNAFVDVLQANGVHVVVINDTVEPHKPDAIFPNNWVSFHENGDVFMYPMQAENRRLERREDVIRQLENEFKVNHIIDLSRFELENKFLEGTGSMVLDRDNKIAYACLSPRTSTEVLEVFCKQTGYSSVSFHAVDQNNTAIYHTNVLMCIAHKYAVICLQSIADETERQNVTDSLTKTGKTILEITFDQMNQFAGNMLELTSKEGESLLVMSKRAYHSLTKEQRHQLEHFSKIIYADLEAIENNGGGSARCMMAEVRLPRQQD